MLTPLRCSITHVTDDLDEANAPQSAYGRIRRQCIGRGPLGMRSWRVSLGKGAIGWSRTAVGQRVRAEVCVPIVHVPVDGIFTYCVGRRHFDAAPGHATLLPPQTGYLVGYDEGATMLAFIPDALELAAELSGRAGDARRSRLVPSVRSLHDPARLVALEAILARWRDVPAIEGAGIEAAHCRAELTAWLAAFMAEEAESSMAGAAAESRLRLAEEWIDAHLAEPITLGRLCAVAGLGASGLRKSFLLRRGVTPMRWVFLRRMAAARLSLMDPGVDETVTRIAHDCGLVHPGRFSVAYRRRYGESPSLTRERTQGKA